MTEVLSPTVNFTFHLTNCFRVWNWRCQSGAALRKGSLRSWSTYRRSHLRDVLLLWRTSLCLSGWPLWRVPLPLPMREAPLSWTSPSQESTPSNRQQSPSVQGSITATSTPRDRFVWTSWRRSGALHSQWLRSTISASCLHRFRSYFVDNLLQLGLLEMFQVLLSVRVLLSEPNPRDPLVLVSL